MVLCLVILVSSLSTSNTPAPGVITTATLPVLSKLRSMKDCSNTGNKYNVLTETATIIQSADHFMHIKPFFEHNPLLNSVPLPSK